MDFSLTIEFKYLDKYSYYLEVLCNFTEIFYRNAYLYAAVGLYWAFQQFLRKLELISYRFAYF